MLSRSTSPPSSPRPSGRSAFRSLALLAMAALAVGSVDCAQERPAIDRTQANGLPKSFFIGSDYQSTADDPEFYINNYVVDGSAEQTLIPVGTYDQVDRIRWEIQEGLLLARKAYETIDNTDGRGRPGRPTQNGTIVAAYRIESQFDRRQAYNPSTGEAINVWEENVSDRRWYERDYIRVDWTRNLADNPDWAWLFYGSIFGDLRFSPVAYDETNPRSPNAPNFCEMQPNTVRGPNGQCVRSPSVRHNGGYFDVTSKWLVEPEMNNSFGEPIPTCLIANFFSGSPVYPCNPQEATIRTSFRRVEDRDFEPLEQTVAPYDLVGGPRANRTGYDPNYGILDQNFHRYAMIHNLWQRSHLAPSIACASNADANNDGTADACPTSHPGSQCDMVMGRCTLPYREREIRPIAYYVNPEMPAEMQNHVVVPGANGEETYRLPTPSDPPASVVRGPSEDIAASWNVAVMHAIANAREVECRRTGGDRDMCHGLYFETGTAPQEDGAWLSGRPKANNGPAVVLCHNPTMPTDSQTACREAGYSARLGDIRYNHMTYWPHYSRAPFGGIAHWGFDPLTGEVISNGGLTMGRSVELAAGQQRDYILMALGELSVNEFVQGAAATRFAQTVRNPAAGVANRMSDEEVAQRVASVDHQSAARGISPPTVHGTTPESVLEAHDQLLSVSNPITTTAADARYEALASQLRNTTLESDMVDPRWLANLGFDPNSPRTASLLDQASPLRRMDPTRAEGMRASIQDRLEHLGFCFQDIGAPGVVGSQDIQGVARWFRQKYGALSPEARARNILRDLRIEAYKGIELHEIGHSLGLYHVPVSSYDSMNYNPQYWQLRTHNGTSTASCTPACQVANCPNVRNADRNQDNCMGPRYLDPYTDDELGISDSNPNPHAGVNYFGNTSVMEYQWERFDETVGIGSYDHYAMGILYGRVLETMESDPARGGMATSEQDRFSARLRTQLGEQDQIRYRNPVLAQEGVLPVHYTELARQMNIFDPARCRDATAEERERYRWRVVDGKLCGLAPRDHAALVDFESTTTSATSTRVAPSWRTTVNARTGGNNLRWGYRVAWDRGTGYPHINYFDQGADIYEVTQSMIRKYELTYPSLYFRRGNRDFNRFGIPAYLARNIFGRIRGYHWSVARDAAFYGQNFSAQTYNQISTDDNWLRPYLMAGPEIFDFFAGVLLRPQPGQYVRMGDQVAGTRTVFDAIDPTDTPDAMNPLQFEVGIVDGRYIDEEYNNIIGGSWDYNAYVNRTGSYPEKPIAAIMLTDTRPTFSSVSRGLFLDGREFQVNFHTDMPQAFDRLLGGILAEDWDTTAMHVPTTPPSGTAIPALEPRLLPLWTRPSRTNPTGMPSRPAGSQLLFSNIGYRQELPTYVYSMLFSSLNSDLSTIHKMRIWVEGGPEQIDVPEVERVRFSNPETGITYVSRRYGADRVDGIDIDSGIGSRMIARANELLLDTYEVELDSELRPIVNPDGSYRVILNTATHQPVLRERDPLTRMARDGRQQNTSVTRFRNYVGLIDAARYASRILGYGLLR